MPVIDDRAILAEIDSGRLHSLNLPWKEVLHLGEVCHFPQNATLRLRGRMARDFFYLEKGLVCAKIFSGSGRERASLFFGPGCLFNIAAALVKLPEPNDWECLEEVTAWRMEGDLLTDAGFVATYPHLIINLLQGMGINLLSQHSWHTEMYLARPEQRLARYLAGVCESHGGGLDFSPRITQQEAAVHLGMHRATLAAAVRELKLRGFIGCFTYSRLHVLQLDALKQFALEP